MVVCKYIQYVFMYNPVILPKCVHLQRVVLLLDDKSFSPLVCVSPCLCVSSTVVYVCVCVHLCPTLYQ